MALEKLTQLLDSKNQKYVVVKHSKAFTAQEVAASAHVPGDEMAKTVIVKIDGDLKMAVVPATHEVSFDKIADHLGAEEVELATEEEFENLFPDCELGAMPPFGNLYEMDTYVSEALTEDQVIAFNAGTHKELVKMSYDDFESIVQPEVFDLSVKKA